MAKLRVHELAKELGITSKELMGHLKEAGEFVKSSSSSLEPPVVRQMREKFAATPKTKKADAKAAAKAPKPSAAKPAAKKDISLALYDAGLNAFQARKYDEAQRSFADFMKNYPTHSMAPDAQYYLAECYFQRNQFPDAALAYDTVITKFSKSNRTPGAYLKQGICFSKMNQKAAAKARMNELIKKYPNSPEAARAKNFLKTNK